MERLPVMKLRRGIKLLEEREGMGETVQKGDRVIYNVRFFLNQGDEVPLNDRQAEHLPADMIRTEGGRRYVDHRTTIGSREAMAGVEYSLVGMKQGGYRKVRVSPHLAFREKGLPGLVPADAVLLIELWLRKLTRE
jgi:FKBP-type peptidyl-prolyl cis-trans isomerase